jgi:hypothetical protein
LRLVVKGDATGSKRKQDSKGVLVYKAEKDAALDELADVVAVVVDEAEEDTPSTKEEVELTALEVNMIDAEIVGDVLVKMFGTTLASTFLLAYSVAQLSSAHNPFSAPEYIYSG